MNRKNGIVYLLLLLMVACGGQSTTPKPPEPKGDIKGLVTISPSAPSQAFMGEAVTRQLNASQRLEQLELQLSETLNLADKPAFVAGEVIIEFKPGLATAALDRLSISPFEVRRVRSLVSGKMSLYRQEGLSAKETLELAQSLRTRPDIASVSLNYYRYPSRTPNDELYHLMWHYNNINLPLAWDITTGSSEVVVAVLDTGILYDPDNPQKSHSDFESRLLTGYDFVSDLANAGDGDGRDANPFDPGPERSTSYHGSHVAGTIGAASNNDKDITGVDWAAKIQPIRVIGLNGVTVADEVDGILWAAGLAVQGIATNPTPAQIINMSLGGPGCAPAEQEALTQALNAGVIIVVAAGNENDNAANYGPAGCNGPITVGATDFANARAPYSNYGTRVDVMAPGGNTSADLNGDGYIDGVLSFGKDDNTDKLNFKFLQGTSMASPHVAGVIALMKAVKPSLTHEEARQVLQATAQPLSAQSCNRPSANECGTGLIDAYAALQALNTTNPAPPKTDISFSPANLDFGLSKSELELSLTNASGAASIWKATSFSESESNPALTPEAFVFNLNPPQGTIAAGASQTVRISFDRSLLSLEGSYQFSLNFDINGQEKSLALFIAVSLKPSPSVDVKGTLVIACYDLGESCDEDLSEVYVVDDSGMFGSYVFTNLLDGNYLIGGYKDSNANKDIDEGDYFGFYSLNGLGETTVKPPANNINFMIQELKGSDRLAMTRTQLYQLFKLPSY